MTPLKGKKLSKAPAEIVAPTGRLDEPRRGPGRPPIHAEEWTKVTVVLFNRQIAFLDEIAASIRAQNGAAISRAQLIRALVDAAAAARIDFTAARSEADMKAMLLARLSRQS